jgi:hypothetical protein
MRPIGTERPTIAAAPVPPRSRTSSPTSVRAAITACCAAYNVVIRRSVVIAVYLCGGTFEPELGGWRRRHWKVARAEKVVSTFHLESAEFSATC